jgi:UrcA family protein
MNPVTTDPRPVSRPKFTALMLVCGIVGAASVGAVSAATPDEDVPHVAVRYNPQSLDTDRGAQVLYHKIVQAADEVCPSLGAGNPHLVSAAVHQCREAAVARAVFAVHSPKLVAVYTASSKHG